MSQRDLNIRLADLVDEMIDGSPRDRLLHVRQLRDAVQSIAANISEGQSLAGKPRRRSAPANYRAKPDRAEELLAASQPARRDREDVDVAAGVVTAMGACTHVAAPLRVYRLPRLRRSSVPLLPSGSCVVWVVRRLTFESVCGGHRLLREPHVSGHCCRSYSTIRPMNGE
jgi:hypothetical protein